MNPIKEWKLARGVILSGAVAAFAASVSAQVPPTQSLVPVIWAVEDRDGDHLPDRRGSVVTLVGTLTTMPRPNGDTAYTAYLQDATAGTQFLQKGDALARLRIGDVARITGRISVTAGTARIVVDHSELLRRGELLNPELVKIGDLLGERYEGRLVRARGWLRVSRDSRDVRVTLIDRTAEIPVRLRSSFTQAPGFSERLVAGRVVEVVGIARQRDSEPPFDGGFVLEPREVADFTFNTPPNYYKLLSPLLFAALVLALIWARLRQKQAEAHADQLAELTQELQSSEDAYRRSERRYRSLTENSEDGIAVIQRDGTIIFSTPTFDRLMTDAGTVMGASLWRFVDIQDEGVVQRALKSVSAEEGASSSMEFQYTGSKGKTRRLDTHLTNLTQEPSVGGIVLNARDVTDKHNAKDALAASEERLRQAQRMEVVGRLAGGIAHDFNNLLTVIRGHAELLLGEVMQESWFANVQQIHASADRATAMTRQLLAFSRQQVLQPRTVRPADVIREMQPMLTRLIGEHIELVADVRDRVSHVRVDPAQFELTILNLVINSRDAMPSGGRITIGAVSDDTSHTVIWVEDNGCGMNEATLRHAFEPFFTTKPVGKGTGLGLPSVYGFVQQSGGHVNSNSTVGLGTRIEIRLPIAIPDAETIAQETIISTAGGETVLVVEDEAPVRDLIRRFLERDGFKVIQAGSGCEALQLWRQNPLEIDIVLSDVVMPGTTGPQLAEEIHKTASHLPVLLMSGYTQDAIEEYAPAKGLLAIEKPFSRAELSVAIRTALSVRKGGAVRPTLAA